LAAVAVGVYANSLPNDFVYDDRTIVVEDERTHSLSRIGKLFSGGYWAITDRPLYRPITLLSFAINHAATGLDAQAYRAVNLVLHALTCVAVYRLVLLLFGQFWPAMVAGAVFAVHPIHVEAVVPIVGRSELLAGLGVVVALGLYVGDAARDVRRITWRYAVVLLLTWATMLCKESAIVLIGMVVVFDVWRRWCVPVDERTGTWFGYLAGRCSGRYVGMLLAIVIVLWMRQYAVGAAFSGGTRFSLVDNPLVDETWSARLLTGLVLLGKYAHLLITGHPLCCDYSHNAIPVARSLTWPVAGGLICLVVLVVGVVVSLCRRREAALAIVWFAVSYAPAANVLVLIGTLFAERLTYLPSVSVAIAWGLVLPGSVESLWRRGPRGIRGIAVGLAVAATVGLVAYGALTVRRNRVWRDHESLFRDALAKQPESARCQFNMGAWYVSHGDLESGIAHLRRAVDIGGEYYLARTRLASCYLRLSRWQEAADVLESLVDTDSQSEHLKSPLRMLGRARFEMGDFPGAWACFDRIRQIEPKHVEAMRSQAEIMTRRKAGSLHRPTDGWVLIQETVRLDPDNLACLASATRIALRLHRLVEARSYYRRAADALREQAKQAKARGMTRVERRSYNAIARDLEKMWDELRRLHRDRRKGPLSPATRPPTTRDATGRD